VRNRLRDQASNLVELVAVSRELHNLVDPTWRYTDGPRQPILADPQRVKLRSAFALPSLVNLASNDQSRRDCNRNTPRFARPSGGGLACNVRW
jgi:hypothetical protein